MVDHPIPPEDAANPAAAPAPTQPPIVETGARPRPAPAETTDPQASALIDSLEAEMARLLGRAPTKKP
jgi:hypothetical protein